MRWSSLTDAHGGDPPGLIWTTEVNFEPSFTVAQVALSRTSGDGTHAVGIAGIRFRPVPGGPEQSQSFGGWWQWPAMFGRESMTSVTIGMALGSEQAASGYWTLYFW
ncbi:MAG TPA: hypothetical protein VF121_01190 [Thermoanaerobaculia bacterium]|nr:hypothetical protein [Thermoanaerobaculia bacterium]